MVTINPDNHQISIEGMAVSDIAEKYGTPVYVYSQAKIKENINKLRSALQTYFKKFNIQYPVKANSNPHLLRIIKGEELGADCSSPAELYIARKVGFPLNKSTYTGNYESISDLRAAVESGIRINLDDHHRLNDLLALTRPEIISFRINPGIGRGGFEGVVTAGTDAKFGSPYEEIHQAYQSALEAGIKRFGIHMMTGSNVLEPFHFAEITQKLTTIAGEALSDLNIKLEFINIGGGLGIPYMEDEIEIDLDQTYKLVGEVFHDHVSKYNLGDPELVVEPGRYLVGNAGVIISRVTHVKKSYRNFVGIDAGMNTLLRPALYRAYHRILIDGRSAALSSQSGDIDHYLVTGQVCENSDIHPMERPFSSVRIGDLAVILDTGAYGYGMSSNYNNRPRPAEVLVSDKQTSLIREAEKIGDLFRGVPDYSHT